MDERLQPKPRRIVAKDDTSQGATVHLTRRQNHPGAEANAKRGNDIWIHQHLIAHDLIGIKPPEPPNFEDTPNRRFAAAHAASETEHHEERGGGDYADWAIEPKEESYLTRETPQAFAILVASPRWVPCGPKPGA